MKLSMSYPTSNPVLNMKTALNIQYISRIKPLPSISLLNYHEAHHHPVCTLVLNSDTIFLLGVSLGPCILTTCREKKKKQFFSSSSHDCYDSSIGLTPNAPHAQPRHGCQQRTVLFSGLGLQTHVWLLAIKTAAVRFFFSDYR